MCFGSKQTRSYIPLSPQLLSEEKIHHSDSIRFTTELANQRHIIEAREKRRIFIWFVFVRIYDVKFILDFMG